MMKVYVIVESVLVCLMTVLCLEVELRTMEKTPGGASRLWRKTETLEDSEVDSAVGHPWEEYEDWPCMREVCGSNEDCCLRYNICDRSARICTDCWQGHPCTSQRECCRLFPNCVRQVTVDPDTQCESVKGICSDTLTIPEP